MKKILMLMVVACAITGCSTPSEVALSDGRTVITKDAPEFDDKTGFYIYEQEGGERVKVNKDLVETIKPVKP